MNTSSRILLALAVAVASVSALQAETRSLQFGYVNQDAELAVTTSQG